MDDAEFQRGVREAEADIRRESFQLFFQTRGSWGARFTDLMRERFGVQVVHISDITWEAKTSYQHGYNRTVISHINATYGTGSYDGAWQEIQDYREEWYRKWLVSQKTL